MKITQYVWTPGGAWEPGLPVGGDPAPQLVFVFGGTRVFDGIDPEMAILIDGPTGRQVTGAEFIGGVKALSALGLDPAVFRGQNRAFSFQLLRDTLPEERLGEQTVAVDGQDRALWKCWLLRQARGCNGGNHQAQGHGRHT